MKWLALLVGLASAMPAAAQAPNCSRQWTAFTDLMLQLGVTNTPPAGITRSTPDGGCRMPGVSMPGGGGLTLLADSLSWTGTDFARFVDDGLPPTTLAATVKGLVMQSDSGDEALNRHFRDRAANARIGYVWTPDVKGFRSDLSLDVPATGDHLVASALMKNVDFSTQNSLQMSIGALLEAAEVEIRFAGQFDVGERPFGSVLWGPSDSLTEQRAHMRRKIDALPSSVLSVSSKSALKAFFQQVPDPRGLLRAKLNANPEFGLVRLMPYFIGVSSVADSDLAQVFDGVRIDIAYDPL